MPEPQIRLQVITFGPFIPRFDEHDIVPRRLKDVDLAARIGMAARARAQALYSRSTTIGVIKREIFAGIDGAAGQRR